MPGKQIKSYPLSRSQTEFWRIYRDKSFSLNEIQIIRISGDLKTDILTSALKEIARRHESLRTIFKNSETGPVQIVKETAEVELHHLDLSREELKIKSKLFNKICERDSEIKFNLETGPLFNIRLVKFARGEYCLISVFHHLIIDGWSMYIIFKELSDLYFIFSEKKNRLLPKPMQFGEYIKFEYSKKNKSNFKKQEEYWQNQFKDGIPEFILPLSRKTTSSKESFPLIKIGINGKLLKNIKSFCVKNGVTTFIFLFSLFCVLIHKITEKDKILIKTPYSNRNNERLNSVVGLLVSVIGIKNQINENKKYIDFLDQCKNNIINNIANSHYSLSKFTERNRETKKYSEIFFQVITSEIYNKENELIRFTNSFHNFGLSKFDLKCVILEEKDQMQIIFKYNSSLFDEKKIKKWQNYYMQIIKKVLSQQKIKIKNL